MVAGVAGELLERADILREAASRRSRCPARGSAGRCARRGPCPARPPDVRADLLADSAISLMNEILVARNAFEAYLIISAVRRRCRRPARRGGVQSATRLGRRPVVDAPMTIRSGSMKSATAGPRAGTRGSRRSRLPSRPRASSSRASSPPVPTGTVDFITSTMPLAGAGNRRRSPTRRATGRRRPSTVGGVSTQTNTIRRARSTSRARCVKVSRGAVALEGRLEARLVDRHACPAAAPRPVGVRCRGRRRRGRVGEARRRRRGRRSRRRPRRRRRPFPRAAVIRSAGASSAIATISGFVQVIEQRVETTQ